MQVGKRHVKAWIDREHICPYCGAAHSNAGDLREHVRSSCPCIEDDYIPARYTRFARQRDYNMDPRYEALSDVSHLPPDHPALRALTSSRVSRRVSSKAQF